MTPPIISITTRELKNYSDDLAASDYDSTSSQTLDEGKNQRLILPKNTSKRTRNRLTKEIAKNNDPKRTKNA